MGTAVVIAIILCVLVAVLGGVMVQRKKQQALPDPDTAAGPAPVDGSGLVTGAAV